MNKKLLASACLFFTTISVFAQFGPFASAVHLSKDGGTNKAFYNTYKLVGDINAIGLSNFDGDLGTYNQQSGQLLLIGAEVKTFRGNNDNVCGAKMYYRIYPVGNPAGSFTLMNLPFFANCNSGVFGDGKGPCNPTDQKWQTVASNIDLTNTVATGTYTLELYFEINGKTNSTTECSETQYDSNFGNNYKANFSISPALPVRLIDFKATSKQGKPLLNWSTLSEDNFSRFIVQRSVNGMHFHDVAIVSAKGNSNTRINYQFLDNTATEGQHFYRLYQLDNDGKYAISNIVKVHVVSNVTLALMPNPAKSQLLIRGCMPGDRVSITDAAGRILSAQTASSHSITIDIHQLKTGKYFANISSSTAASSLSFVKE